MNMDTLLRLSSSFTNHVVQQTKDYSVKIAATAGTKYRTKVASTTDSECDDDLFDRLKTEASKVGIWISDPQCVFQDYLLIVEDSVINHLLSFHQDLQIAADVFKEAAVRANLHDFGMNTYSLSPIGEIKRCIRMISSARPSLLFKSIDWVIVCLIKSNEMMKPFLKSNLRRIIMNYDAFVSPQVVLYPLHDEIFSLTHHLHWQLLPSTRESGNRPKQYAVILRRAGSKQVNGNYYAVGSESQPTYENRTGYRIIRYDYISSSGQFTLPEEYQSYAILPRELYIWRIISASSLSICYYICWSVYRSSLPPSNGWLTTAHGHLPPPILELTDDSIVLRQGQTDSTNVSINHQMIFPPIRAPLKSVTQTIRGDESSSDCVTGQNLFSRILEARTRISKSPIHIRHHTSHIIDKISHLSDIINESNTLNHNLDFQDEGFDHSQISSLNENSLIELLNTLRKATEKKFADAEGRSMTLRTEIGTFYKERKSVHTQQMTTIATRLRFLSTANVSQLFDGLDEFRLSPESEDVEETFKQKWALDAVLDREIQALRIATMEKEKITAASTSIVSNSSTGTVVASAAPQHVVELPTTKPPETMTITSSTSSISLSTNNDNINNGISGKVAGTKDAYSLEAKARKRDTLEALLSSFTSQNMARNAVEVAMLGVEMWPPNCATDQRLHYVFRVCLDDRRRSPPDNVSLDTSLSAWDGIRSSVSRRQCQGSSRSRIMFTVRRDLSSLAALHAELDRLLRDGCNDSGEDRDIVPPPFPDPFRIGVLEEEFVSALKSRRARPTVPMREGSSRGRGLTKKNSVRGGSGKSLGWDASSHPESGGGTNPKLGSSYAYHPSFQKKEGCEIDPVFCACLDSLRDYLHSVILLTEAMDEVMDGVAEVERTSELLRQMGRLLGSFLQAGDIEGLLDAGVEEEPQQLKPTPQQEISISLDEEEAGTRPCWFRHTTGGLTLSLRVTDDQGGKLSLRSEEETLRVQRSKCRGCGEPLHAGFLGLDRNFGPCRYLGGLFCRRWCYADQHRVIPQRMLLYWDQLPHRVCLQAATFLDAVMEEPVLDLTEINPQLYEGVPVLRSIRASREVLASMMKRLLTRIGEDLQQPEEGEESANRRRTVEAIVTVIGPRLHLVTGTEPYSLYDVVQASSGTLKDKLDSLLCQIDVGDDAAQYSMLEKE